jgi:hypothetical protein
MIQFLEFIFKDWVTFAQFCILSSMVIFAILLLKDITFTFNHNYTYTDKTPEPELEFFPTPIQDVESDTIN